MSWFEIAAIAGVLVIMGLVRAGFRRDEAKGWSDRRRRLRLGSSACIGSQA